jgi:hypothetical protein
MNDVCSICLHTINELCQTNCNHFFCKDCLDSWFNSKKNTCPLCRSDIEYFIHNGNINRVVCIEKKIVRERTNVNVNPNSEFVYIKRKNYLAMMTMSLISVTILPCSLYFISRCRNFSY